MAAAALVAAELPAQVLKAPPAAQPQPQQMQPVPDILRIRRFSGLGTKNIVKSPEFKTNAQRGINPLKDWFQVAVQYDTAPEWVDELTFQYFVMSQMRVEGEIKFSIFSATVRYSDIQSGSHTSTAFLHPKALERFGEIAAAAVEILYQGKVIAQTGEVEAKTTPEDWWKNPIVTGNANVTARDGYLLDRARSPFALINIDDYEFIK
jgi:hypothetical protein